MNPQQRNFSFQVRYYLMKSKNLGLRFSIVGYSKGNLVCFSNRAQTYTETSKAEMISQMCKHGGVYVKHPQPGKVDVVVVLCLQLFYLAV